MKSHPNASGRYSAFFKWAGAALNMSPENSGITTSLSTATMSSKHQGKDVVKNELVKKEEEEDVDYVPYVPLKKRRMQDHDKLAAHRKEVGTTAEKRAEEEKARLEAEIRKQRDKSLVDIAMEIKAKEGEKTERDQQVEDEQYLLDRVTGNRQALMSAAQAAGHARRYTEPMQTGWRPPRHIREMSKEEADKIREKWHIEVEGEDVVPPIKKFSDMRFPPPIMEAMKAKGITKPTPIQVQCIPVALSGRDMIGIAFTGSGKTMTFCLPMIMFALRAEMKMSLVRGEGPTGIIVSPSRELATQTWEVTNHFTSFLAKGRFPVLRCLLAIGGIDLSEQGDIMQNGIHMVVATPGRLLSLLKQKKINCDLCKYLCLDEADRLIDLGFEEDMRTLFDYFKEQYQTVLFSATMPKKIQDFALQSMVKPVVVNVGRAGAANLDVIQEVEYVKPEAKIVYLLECLQKTPPPVLVFASNTQAVDDIHEYLLLKGVDTVAVHGSKDQNERLEAVKLFKEGKRDVLVATDVASKGLDFPNVQHVINYDMPKEIEDYVHRIGRTGRCGKTGVATSFINRECDETLLLDLKHLLIEAKQKVPPVLQTLHDPTELYVNVDGIKGCAYCGGLGHRLVECPKLLAANKGSSHDKHVFGYDTIESHV
eukprot:g16460.t1